MNDIFDFRKKLVAQYKQFSSSFASPRASDIAHAVKAAYDDGKFWPDPLVQINPNYRTGGNIADLAATGVVEPETAQVFQVGKQDAPPHPQPITLYRHQMEALNMVAGGKSYVVTTGTGSGKSLTFFIPIVNRIIKEKKVDHSKRIRAIIVYPMNALANSQFEEIGKFLDGSPLVSVKRYTGQESASERAAIKANPPDILLTNYVMLDLILTRYHEDHEVVEAAQNLEFLVLDELHTYRGRQGADVAMLVRRIRAQLNAKNMLCIGTSATMASVGSTEDRQLAVANVAAKIFDAEIPAQQVILEELEYATAAIPDAQVAAALPARVRTASSWVTLGDFRNDPLAVWIEHNLGISRNPSDEKLERAKPLTLREASEKLSVAAACSCDEAETALRGFLTGLYAKKDWEGGRAPFAFKLHQFISGPGQVMTTLEKPGERIVELDMQRFAPGTQDAEKRLYATYFCRFCGQEYIPVWFTTGDSGSGKLVMPRELSDNSKQNGDDENTHPGFLCPIDTLDADSVFPCPFDTASEAMKEFLPDEWFTINKKGERVLGDTYKDRTPVAIRVLPNGQLSATDGTPFWYLPGAHTWCLNCGQTHGASGRDNNRLVGLSGEGRSSATTILTLSALNLMYAQKEGANKLLGFTDNRQDAALQSGHFNEFIFTVTLRSALLAALEHAPEQRIESGEISARVFETLGFKTVDREILAEYLENPDLIGGALRAAQKVLGFMLGYRLHADLGREWRFNNPNLEQLRLLKIKYNWVHELINSEKLLANEILGSLSVKKRQQFAELVFDHLRKSLCIRSDYFDPEEQDQIRKGGNGYLLEAWRMPSDRDHLDRAKDLYLFKQRKEDLQQNDATRIADRQLTKHDAVSGSFSSRLFKLLVRGHGGSGRSLWKETQWTADSAGTSFANTTENRALLFDAVRVLLLTARDAGIVEASNIGSEEHPVIKCRLDASSIVWVLSDEEESENTDRVRADGSIRNRFFIDLYQRTAQALGSGGQKVYLYESHEHTAQVEPELREMLEMRFRNKAKDRDDFAAQYPDQRFKPLPVLYCSPTMELGVDISTLDMVYMRNVPPTPANYAQRSGRAGRSGQAALVVTYCTSLSPHDQWFFQRIADMVHGEVCVPALDLTNKDLVDSHLRAVWMSQVKKDLPVNISELLQMENVPALPLKPEILASFTDPSALAAAKELAHRIMTRLADTEYTDGRAQWYHADYEATVIDDAAAKFTESLERWRSLYLSTINQLEEANKRIKNPAVSAQERERAKMIVIDATNQINVLLAKTDGHSSSKNQDFYLYRYLASEGVLPGYSFPRLPVTAWVPRVRSTGGKTKASEISGGTVISRPRFLALSEFGPLSLIYHEGHTFCVRRVKLRAADFASGDGGATTVVTTSVRVCPNCGCAHFASDDSTGVSNCQHCGAVLKSEYTIPELYQVNAVEARIQDRISLMDEERQRRGYDLRTVYGFEPGHAPSLLEIVHDGVQLATLAYAPAAKISRINLGWRRRADKNKFGFWMDPTTGQWTGEDDPAQSEHTDGAGEVKVRAKPQKIVPFVNDHRNALIITPPDDIVGDEEAVVTLVAALQRGLEQVFQIESGEIAAEPVPSAANPRKILVYEASEGGAGALCRLALDPCRAQILAAVAEAALVVMHYERDAVTGGWKPKADVKCVAGCYKCLLSYYNQPQHEKIDRRNIKVVEYLKSLCKVVSTDYRDVSAVDSQGLDGVAGIPEWAVGAVAFDKTNRIVTFSTAPSEDVRTACEERGYEVVIR